MRVIAYTSEAHPDGAVTLRESTGQSITSTDLHELLKWLLDDWKPDPDTLFVTWNLGQFTAPLLRKLGTAACQNLANPQYNRTELFRPYVIFFRYKTDTGGIFKIECGPLRDDNGRKHRTQECTIYSLAQFFDRDAADPGVETCQQLGDTLLRELATAGIHPTKLTSPVAAYLSSAELPAPKSRDAAPNQVYAEEYAEKCSHEWRDCFQVGHWTKGNAFDYDITSAYASVAATLLDTRDAEFLYSKDYIPGAYWGFLKGKVTLYSSANIHPIITTMTNGQLGTPTGCWDTYLTQNDVRFITQSGIGHFELQDGWFVKFKHGERPLADTMQDLYTRRRISELRNCAALPQFLKSVGNGFVGKFLEKYDRLYTLPDGTKTNVGEFYNAIWHAVVTDTTRLKVAEFIYKHNAQDNVIGVNTDGCLLDRQVPLLNGNHSPGQWRLSGTHPVIVLSPQRVMSGHKHPQGMSYDTLIKLIADKPDSQEYTETGQRYITLSEAVEAGDISSVGELASRGRSLILPAMWESQTRHFPKFPLTGAELLMNHYRSVPHTVCTP